MHEKVSLQHSCNGKTRKGKTLDKRLEKERYTKAPRVLEGESVIHPKGEASRGRMRPKTDKPGKKDIREQSVLSKEYKRGGGDGGNENRRGHKTMKNLGGKKMKSHKKKIAIGGKRGNSDDSALAIAGGKGVSNKNFIGEGVIESGIQK